MIGCTRRTLLRASALVPLASFEARAAAQEWRIVAPLGVVRVFLPRHYQPREAGLVLYVHGFYTDIDRAWREHRLPEQFAASERNALFVAPAARSAAGQRLPFPDLRALLALVAGALGEPLPRRPLVAAGHSAAYKQIGAWLDHPRLQTILLLDGLYGLQRPLRAWLQRRRPHRMALVNNDTAASAAAWTRPMRYAIQRERCPDSAAAFTARERAAKVLTMGAAADHMGIVTEGKVLPLLLRWTNLPGRP
jgi:hypothetical protein